MKYIKLNTGENMPIIGTGTNTYGKENNEYQGKLTDDFTDLEHAIQLGYRSIDAAVSYRNEAGVGETLANSGIPREEFFITTKIPRIEFDDFSEETINQIINQSLDNFHTDYLDLYLIHHPIENEEQLKITWKILEGYYQNGVIKSIGVSNFTQNILDKMEKFATVKPAVNQIQINLKEPNKDLIEQLKKMDIVPVAWGPMKASKQQKEKLKDIGKKYNKTWGQILLKYQIQREIVVIPKSHNPDNQKHNLDLFNFELTKQDLEIINNLTK